MKSWDIKMYDYVIIGAGIIGLNIAKNLKERFPDSKIVVLEKSEEDLGRNLKNLLFYGD